MVGVRCNEERDGDILSGPRRRDAAGARRASHRVAGRRERDVGRSAVGGTRLDIRATLGRREVFCCVCHWATARPGPSASESPRIPSGPWPMSRTPTNSACASCSRDCHGSHRTTLRSRSSTIAPRALDHESLGRAGVRAPPNYTTGSVNGGCICNYLWDFGEPWEIFPLYDPAASRSHIQQFVAIDMASHFSFDPLGAKAWGRGIRSIRRRSSDSSTTTS